MFVLLKFVEGQFTESTLDGGFYFSRNGCFIDLETQQYDKGIGDKREGVWSDLFNPETKKLFVSNEEGTMIPLNVTRMIYRKTYMKLRDVPVCCFVLLSLEKDFEVNKDKKKLILKPDIEKNLTEQFKGRDLIFITDIYEILRRFDVACGNEDLSRIRGRVKYYDDETEPHPLSKEEFNKDPAKTLLYKRRFFEYQKEYRIILSEPQENDRALNIGSVRDIAYNMGNVKEGRKLPFELSYKEAGSSKNE